MAGRKSHGCGLSGETFETKRASAYAASLLSIYSLRFAQVALVARLTGSIAARLRSQFRRWVSLYRKLQVVGCDSLP
jgi:hypothetical protein